MKNAVRDRSNDRSSDPKITRNTNLKGAKTDGAGSPISGPGRALDSQNLTSNKRDSHEYGSNVNMVQLAQGPTMAEYYELYSRVDQIEYEFSQQNLRLCQIDAIKKDMTVLSQNSQLKQNDVMTLVKEGQIHQEKLLAKIEFNEKEMESIRLTLEILKDEHEYNDDHDMRMSDSHAKTLGELKTSLTKFKAQINAKVNSIQDTLKQQKIMEEQRDFDKLVERIHELELNSEKMIDQQKKFQQTFAKRQYLDHRLSLMKDEIQRVDDNGIQLQNALQGTEIFIDRYLPCKILNLIYDSLLYGDVFQKRRQRCSFVSNLHETFLAQKSKIKLEEEYDSAHPKKRINNLKKTHYHIPDIGLPECFESSESEGDSASDQSGGEHSGELANGSLEGIIGQSRKPKRVRQRGRKPVTASARDENETETDDDGTDDQQDQNKKGHARDAMRDFVSSQDMIDGQNSKRKKLGKTKIKLANIPKYQKKQEDVENVTFEKKESDSNNINISDKKFNYEGMTLYKKREETKQRIFEQERQKRLQEAAKRFNQQAENPIVKKPGEITPDLLPREVMDLEEGKVIPQSQFISPKMEEKDSVDSEEVRKMKLQDTMQKNMQSKFRNLSNNKVGEELNHAQLQQNNVEVQEPNQVQQKEGQSKPEQNQQNQPGEIKRIIDDRKSILKLSNQQKSGNNKVTYEQMEEKVKDAEEQPGDEAILIDKKKDKKKRDKDNYESKDRKVKEQNKIIKNKNRGSRESQHMEIHKEVAMTKISMKLQEQFSVSKQNKQAQDSNLNVQNLSRNQPLRGGQTSQTFQSSQQQEDINEMKIQISELIKKLTNEIKEVKDRQNKDKDSWIQKINFIDKSTKQLNQKIQNEIKTTNQKTQEEMMKKVCQVKNDLLENNKQLLSQMSENYATVYKQVVQLRSDFKIEVEKAKSQLGIGHSQLSSNIDLYSLSRVIDLILQYLLVHRFFDEDYVNFDISMNDFVNNYKEDKLADIQIGNAQPPDKLAQCYDQHEENRKRQNSNDRIITEITELTNVNNKSNCDDYQSVDGQNEIQNIKRTILQVNKNPSDLENSKTTVIKFDVQESLSSEQQITNSLEEDQAQSVKIMPQTMSSPQIIKEDIEIRSRKVTREKKPSNQSKCMFQRMADPAIEMRSVGEVNFMKERQSLRAHKVIEQAWLVFQFMKNNKQRISFEDGALTPNRLEALLDGLRSDKFGVVRQMMDKSNVSRLVNDEDCSLTANSLLNYAMLIKQKKPSVEGKLVEGYINRKLWEDLHTRKNNYYEIPISQPTQKELLTSIHTKNDIPIKLNESVMQKIDAKQKQLDKLKKAMVNYDQIQNSFSQNEIQSIVSTQQDDNKQVSMNQQNYMSFFQSRQKMQQRSKQRSTTTQNQTVIDNEQFLEPETVGLSIMSDKQLSNVCGQVTNTRISQKRNESNRFQAFSQRDSCKPTKRNHFMSMDQGQMQAQRKMVKSPVGSHKTGDIKDLTKIYNQNSFNFDLLTSHHNSTASHQFIGKPSAKHEPGRASNQSSQLTDYLGGLQKSKSRQNKMRNVMSNKNLGSTTQVTKIPMSIVQAHIASKDYNLSPNRSIMTPTGVHLPNRSVMTPTGQLFNNQSVNYIDGPKRRGGEPIGVGANGAMVKDSMAISTKNLKQTHKLDIQQKRAEQSRNLVIVINKDGTSTSNIRSSMSSHAIKQD